MWIIYAFLATISSSIGSIYSKKVVSKVNENISIWGVFIVSTLIAGLYALNTDIVILSSTFYLWLFTRIIIDSVAMYTYFKALNYEDVSYVIPLMTLLPVLTIGTSALINHQVPSIKEFIGIILVVIGTGSLFLTKINSKTSSQKDRGKTISATIFMLTTIIIWSFAEAIHKQAIDLSSPSTYFFFSYLGFTLIFSVIVFLFHRKEVKTLFQKENWLNNLGQGVGQGLSRIFALNAVVTGLVAYVSAIRGSSVIFTTIFAGIFLKEKISKNEIFGILIAFAGISLTIL